AAAAGLVAAARVLPDRDPRGAVGLRLRRRPVHGDGPRPAAPREARTRLLGPRPPGHRVGCRLPVRSMRSWRVLLLLAAPAVAGAAATLAAGALAGMHGGDLAHLAVLLVPAALAVAVAVAVARPLVARSSFPVAMVATSAVSSAVGAGSLVVLSRMMFV